MALNLYLVALETDGPENHPRDFAVNSDAVRLDNRFEPVTLAAHLVGQQAWIRADQAGAWTGIGGTDWGNVHTSTRAKVLAVGVCTPKMRMPEYDLGQPTGYINILATPLHKVVRVPDVGLEFLAETIPHIGKRAWLSVTPGGPADGTVERLVIFNDPAQATAQAGRKSEVVTLTGVGYGIKT